MSSPRVALAVFALVLLVGGAAVFAGPLTRERTPVASTGAPPPFGVRAPVDVKPGQELCANDVLLSRRAAVAELVLDQGNRPAPDLAFTVRSQAGSSRPVTIRGGRTGVHTITAPFAAPRTDRRGSVCLRNTGRVAARFVGTEEFRAMTALRTTVDGQDVPPDVALNFYEGKQVTVLSFLPSVVGYMSAFRGFLGTPWIIWPLMLLVFAGVPLATLWVLYRAVRPVP